MDVMARPTGDEGVEGALVAGTDDADGSERVAAEDAPHPPEGSEEEDSSEEWETASLYEDALQFISDEHLRGGGESRFRLLYLAGSTSLLTGTLVVPGACTFEEAMAYRKRLRSIGQAAFISETLGQGTVSAKTLCTAFGIMPPSFLEGAPDKAYHPLLSLGMSKESSKRLKLPDYNTIDDVVQLMQKAKKIIVITGAGVSYLCL